MGLAIGTNEYQNPSLLSLTGGARKVGAVQYTPEVYTGGVVDTTSMPSVNLENKTGTSNQAFMLPGRGVTYAARSLDFSA